MPNSSAARSDSGGSPCSTMYAYTNERISQSNGFCSNTFPPRSPLCTCKVSVLSQVLLMEAYADRFDPLRDLRSGLRLDQVLSALAVGERQRLLVQGRADGAVGAFGFCGEGLHGVRGSLLVAGATEAADARWSERQVHGAVDPAEDAGQLALSLHEHDAPDASGAACDPLRDADDFHAVLPVPDPYAVISRAELVAHLPHLGRHPQPRESGEDEGCRLVVAVPDATPGFLIVRGTDDREPERAEVRGGSAAARGADEHGVAQLAGGRHGLSETGAERVAARHPDVAGGRRDRNGSGPSSRRHLVEDRPHVAVADPGILKAIGQEKLHAESLQRMRAISRQRSALGFLFLADG